MPVIGHAFVGWATALEVPPRPGPGGPAARSAALWVPALVALAYGPDVVAQGGVALGWADAPRAAHSLAFALLAALLAGWALGLVLGVRQTQAAMVCLASFVVHDLLDLLQTPEREPLWPLSRWHLGDRAALIPVSGIREALLFAGAFTLYLAARRLARPPGLRSPRPERLTSAVLVLAIVGAAATTHVLRVVRERQLEQARRLVREGRYAEALGAAAGADRWPSTAHPGRVDHVRAEAFEELGLLEEAIAGYSRAVEADPANFWAVADLAAACARSPRAERLAAASSLRARLLRDFPSHPALAAAVARIDRRLAGDGP
jgi:membrane-bound metal-dependent hydrolase YbcI (DUF457 family)